MSSANFNTLLESFNEKHVIVHRDAENVYTKFKQLSTSMCYSTVSFEDIDRDLRLLSIALHVYRKKVDWTKTPLIEMWDKAMEKLIELTQKDENKRKEMKDKDGWRQIQPFVDPIRDRPSEKKTSKYEHINANLEKTTRYHGLTFVNAETGEPSSPQTTGSKPSNGISFKWPTRNDINILEVDDKIQSQSQPCKVDNTPVDAPFVRDDKEVVEPKPIRYLARD